MKSFKDTTTRPEFVSTFKFLPEDEARIAAMGQVQDGSDFKEAERQRKIALGTYHLTVLNALPQVERNEHPERNYQNQWTKEDEEDAAIQLEAFYAKHNTSPPKAPKAPKEL